MKGLSSTEAENILKKDGYNELPSARPKGIFRIALEVFKEPMFLLLISCATLYMLLGDVREGFVLMSTILLIILITFYQYRKTEKALDALRQLSAPRALVIRDGKEIRIPGRDLVKGDCLILQEGDRVPADARLLDGMNLTIDESILTGESVAVRKETTGSLDDPQCLLWSGTLVVQGRGRAEVLATGLHTQFGKIGRSLQELGEDQTRLQKEMKLLIRRLFFIGIILSLLVVVLNYLTRGDFLKSLLQGLAASMAILPEEFPVVLTIFLALGSWRLSKQHILTRRSSAIESLGSATVLCSDKTGTITQNKMELAVLYIGEKRITKKDFAEEAAVLKTAVMASQLNSIDPMEKALLEALPQKNLLPSPDRFVSELPLSRELLAMTCLWKDEDPKSLRVCTKGAPEAIFHLCKLSAAEQKIQKEKVEELAAEGYRVIALADGNWSAAELPLHQEQLNLQYIGLLALHDPIRPSVPDAIRQCREAGIRIIMITGDYPATALSIGKQIGLADTEVVSGEELKQMSDEELQKRIQHIGIFARVVPEQKLRIVHALKANQEIVAMTGDGVNDAPALKAAHIGIAMGIKGTDVAREASSLVLLDDNFASIVAAIRAGRRIYDNLQKAMSYIMAIHIPIIGLTLLPSFLLALPILLFPLHIVFMELIIDPACSIAFESEQEESGIMKRKPRPLNERFFGFRKILYSLIQGSILLAMVLIVHFASTNEGHTDAEARAIAFSSLILGNIFLICTNLTQSRSFLFILIEKSGIPQIIFSVSFLILLLILYVPYLQKLFNFENPGLSHFFIPLISATAMLFLFELIKWIRHPDSYLKFKES